MGRKHMLDIYSNASLVAALSQVQSGFLDLGKRCGLVDIIRSNTNGTYVFEIDWSIDGTNTQSTDTITTVSPGITQVVPTVRFARFRVKNTHGTNAFTAHSTVVARDAGGGK